MTTGPQLKYLCLGCFKRVEVATCHIVHLDDGGPALLGHRRVGCSSISAAAKTAKVDESTIRTWLRHDPDFVAEYRGARARVLDETLGELIDAGGAAVQTLRTSLEAKSESVRVSAARALLEHLARSHDDQELADRVGRLYELVENMGVKL